MTKNPVFEVDDLIVVLLASPSQNAALTARINGSTRLEKLIYLLVSETRVPEVLTESANYVPYHYGPFSKKVYESIDMLEAAGLVRVRVDGLPEIPDETRQILGSDGAPYAERQFDLTELGLKYFEALKAELPDWALREVADVKQTFGSLPLRQLVRYVYENHPEMTENSVIRDQVLGV